MQRPAFVLFSGHNDRAVVALCRFLRGADLPFAIVAAGRADAIHRTAYADAVIFDRLDPVLSVGLFAGIADAVGGAAIHCPTTEFANDFLLAHRVEVQAAGWIVGLPSAQVYHALTSKNASRALVAQLGGVHAPGDQSLDALRVPCVLKPRVNVRGGRVLYPILCPDEAALARARSEQVLDADTWFAQDWVEGQSRYLCGYLAADGRRAWYWQDNLLQQPGGKSIVLARTAAAPAFDSDAFLDGLHALGYRGPIMMELIEDAAGRLHYIEINPRFWGPLQLALAACPQLLALFASDHGSHVEAAAAPAGTHYYAWARGADSPGCRRYPAAAAEGDETALRRLLERHDVYAGADTEALHCKH